MEKLMNVPTSHALGSLGRIADAVDMLEGTVHEDVFWNYVLCHKEEIMPSGKTLSDEAIDTLNLCTNAVARYDLVMRDQEAATYRAVERVASGALENDVKAFVDATRRAEMKVLWLNRQCKETTGKYFFTGRLPKIGGQFTIEGMFALAYQTFLVIDPEGNV